MSAALHSLWWLVIANFVGILLAVLLVVPRINVLLAPWTYGRWMPVHINLQLYGWCSLPLVGFLFWVYGASRSPLGRWASPVLWCWSAALGAGVISWLMGHSSGKLFLDWTGYARDIFPLAMSALWLFLAALFRRGLRTNTWHRGGIIARLLGLVLLLPIPAWIYIACYPGIYPPVNPDTGGPTGASQLESALVIVAILLVLPFGIAERNNKPRTAIPMSFAIFAIEALLCLALGRPDVSHHKPTQYISLASLLVWMPLVPAYYRCFHWHPQTQLWRTAVLCWWAVLVPTGWCLFLPGVLDHFKFTDGLVAHSLLAMAGFSTSLLILVMTQLLGDRGWIFTRRWSFYAWQGSVAAYVAVMLLSGWVEGFNPAFAFQPGTLRLSLYIIRLLLGVTMTVSSAEWLWSAHRESANVSGDIDKRRKEGYA